MAAYFLRDSNLPKFVDGLIATKKRVWGPVAKKTKFVFSPLGCAEELRLDYDVTLLPPKKAIFPTTQDLVTFSPQGPASAIAPKPQILFGVHFYDIKAIDMLDRLFTENHADENYLAVRRATTIVGSSIQKVSARGFWGTVGIHIPAEGHDAFLTKLKNGYLFETLTRKGEALLACGKFTRATAEQILESQRVNAAIFKRCREQLGYPETDVARRVRDAFVKEELWTELARDCFSCGTCNIVCPTCYCFDVQDHWNLDQVSGARCRTWDGCQLEEFAEVSLGAGGKENFREERGDRYRHRLMRKLAYLNPRLGGPACVGCGRCSAGCVPDIADPVKIVARIMEA
jgi:sulfhydrogenase subunit beta (sulfur reductase)